MHYGPFVVYDINSTLRLDKLHRKCKRESFETLATARAALTRALKKDVTLIRNNFAITDSFYFYKHVEKKVMKYNLMSGKPFIQGVNTHICCDPSSETYWSM